MFDKHLSVVCIAKAFNFDVLLAQIGALIIYIILYFFLFAVYFPCIMKAPGCMQLELKTIILFL